VVDLTGEIPVILRPGAVTAADVREVCGDCLYGGESSEAPKCPGMKYTHYSPKADVFAVREMEALSIEKSEDVAIISYDNQNPPKAQKLYSAGKTDEEYAARLFYLLRKADEDNIKTVYAVLPKDEGIGTAVRNRLLKAAGGKVI
jgi:L-threonylcarbamoyladenylate synthase